MVRYLLAIGLALIPIEGFGQQVEKQKGENGSTAQVKKTPKTLKEIQDEYSKAQNEFYKPYSEAKTDEERAKIKLDYSKMPGPEFVKMCLELADANPKSETGAKALSFAFRLANGNRTLRPKILDRLITEYIDSDSLSQVMSELAYDPAAEKPLRKVYEQSKSKKAKGTAAFSLAKVMLREFPAGMLKADPSAKGKTRQEKEKAAIDLLKIVEKDFSDISLYGKKTLGTAAASEIFEIENLGVGKTAPDIEGEDIDGKKFKLSDYRGKVIMIDFWGDW